MKKFLSVVLAIAILISGYAVMASAELNLPDIYIATHPEHVRKGDVVYYPHKFRNKGEDFADLCKSLGIKSGEAKLTILYEYDSSSLEFVDILESKVLYYAGGKAEVVDRYDAVPSYGFPLDKGFTVEITFDIGAQIDNEILFNLKFNVLEENFMTEEDDVSVNDAGYNFLVSDVVYYNDDYENFKWLLCEVTDGNGNVHDLSQYFKTEDYYPGYGMYYETYEELLITGYDPFEPPTGDVYEVTYIQTDDTHKQFTAKINGRKSMIQFIEPDGGTRTYDRYNKNVKITSYNADDKVVNAMARDLAYEVWEIYSNMSVGVEIKARVKESGKWNAEKYSFTIEPYNPIISMELSSTSGKKGAVPATVVADEKTEKVMLKMPDGSSATISTFTTDENGNRVFTGKAWMNEDGLNEIKVHIRRDNVWKLAGTLVYTVE